MLNEKEGKKKNRKKEYLCRLKIKTQTVFATTPQHHSNTTPQHHSNSTTTPQHHNTTTPQQQHHNTTTPQTHTHESKKSIAIP
jgi:hypothetical protein